MGRKGKAGKRGTNGGKKGIKGQDRAWGERGRAGKGTGVFRSQKPAKMVVSRPECKPPSSSRSSRLEVCTEMGMAGRKGCGNGRGRD